MKKIRNFYCDHCGTFERFVEDEERVVNCNCGRKSARQLSAPKCFQNTTGKSPCS